MSKKVRIVIGLAIFIFAISLCALVIWLMLLRGPTLTQ
jgi:hypothetical protein